MFNNPPYIAQISIDHINEVMVQLKRARNWIYTNIFLSLAQPESLREKIKDNFPDTSEC